MIDKPTVYDGFYPISATAPLGSVAELMGRLAETGYPIETITRFAWGLPLAAVSPFLRYLQAACLDNGAPTVERIHLYFWIAQGIHPSRYDLLRRFIREVRHKSTFSPDVLGFIEDERIEPRLHDLLLDRFGLQREAAFDVRTKRLAFLRTALTFLENFGSLISADPNLLLLFQALARYGSIQAYFAAHEEPRQVVARLVELGYDVDHMVFGRGEVLSLGPGGSDVRKPWAAWLRDTLHRVLGGRNAASEIDLGINRRGFFHAIRDDFRALRAREDKAAGLRLVNCLLPVLKQRQSTLLRNSQLAEESQVQLLILELHAIRKGLLGDTEHHPAQRLVAYRSPKLVPELLFDNTRLSCCLFKPDGLFHGEICRLILDPATPILEFWMEPHPEFMGLATFYVGLNARGERTMLMDTIDYNDILHELRGYNGTMRFIMDAIVLDAHLSGAAKVAVFASPWGKPLGFANFVKLAASRSSVVRYRDSYYFEAVDPADGALVHSLLGRHHYTEAFGFDNPLVGVIDYSFSVVGWGTVEKLYSGGRGVYEIDVAAYLRDAKTLSRPAVEAIRPIQIDAPVPRAIFARPQFHDAELASREAHAFLRCEIQLAASMPGVRVAAIEEPDGAVVDEVLALEAVAFPEHLRYSRDDICARFSRKAARLIAVRRDGALVAFALCYVMPAISWEDLFVDDLAVQPDLQSKGAGSALVLLIADLALIRGFRGVYVSAEILPDLTRFYERLGFWRVAAAPGIGQVLRRPLGLVTPDGASAAVGTAQREVEQRLGQHFSRPRATFHSTLDPDLLKVLLQLEAAFPDDLRYGEDAFGLRMRLPDAFILVLWEQSEPIAYCLSFNDPSLPAHAITIDSVVVRRELRGRGIGRALMRAALTLPTQAHYTIALLTCRPNSPEGVDLVAFYRSFGAEEVGRLRGEIQMRIPLRIGADTAEASEPTPVRGEPAEAAE